MNLPFSSRFAQTLRLVKWIVVLALSIVITPQVAWAEWMLPRVFSKTMYEDMEVWKARALHVPTFSRSQVQGVEDQRPPRAWIAWDDESLYGLVEVNDTTPNEGSSPDRLHHGDSVELQVRVRDDQPRVVFVIASPGRVPGRAAEMQVRDGRKPVEEWRDIPIHAQMQPSEREGGYSMNFFIPLAALGMDPGNMPVCEITLTVNDRSTRFPPQRFTWYGNDGSPWQRLLLTRDAGTPPPYALSAAWSADLGELLLHAHGTARDLKQPFEVRRGRQVIATGVFAARNSQAVGLTSIPFSPLLDRAEILHLSLGGRLVTSVPMTSASNQVREELVALSRLALASDADLSELATPVTPRGSYVFTGTRLPVWQVDAARLRLGGIRSHRIRYFDAVGGEVTEATKPGRYAVEVTYFREEGTLPYVTLRQTLYCVSLDRFLVHPYTDDAATARALAAGQKLPFDLAMAEHADAKWWQTWQDKVAKESATIAPE